MSGVRQGARAVDNDMAFIVRFAQDMNSPRLGEKNYEEKMTEMGNREKRKKIKKKKKKNVVDRKNMSAPVKLLLFL